MSFGLNVSRVAIGETNPAAGDVTGCGGRGTKSIKAQPAAGRTQTQAFQVSVWCEVSCSIANIDNCFPQ